MNGLPTEILVILCGVGVVVLLWLALRFGKIIALAGLILGALIILGLWASAGVAQGVANHTTAQVALEAVQAVKTTATSQSIISILLTLVVIAMGILLILALGVAGYFAIRWRLVQASLLPPPSPKSQLPEKVQPGQVIYILEEESESVDLSGIDLDEWGFR